MGALALTRSHTLTLTPSQLMHAGRCHGLGGTCRHRVAHRYKIIQPLQNVKKAAFSEVKHPRSKKQEVSSSEESFVCGHRHYTCQPKRKGELPRDPTDGHLNKPEMDALRFTGANTDS